MTPGTMLVPREHDVYTVVTDTASGSCNDGGPPRRFHYVVERALYHGGPDGHGCPPDAWERARGPYVPGGCCWYDLTGPDGRVDGTMNGSAAINGTWIDLRVV